jgi:hypothetical protein
MSYRYHSNYYIYLPIYLQVVIHTFFKKITEPTLAEGFVKVDTIDFVPQELPDPVANALLNYYL